MTARSYLAAYLAVLVAFTSSAVMAQSRVDRSGTLESGDEQLPSGEYTDTYTIVGQQGDLLEVRASSDQFDAFLIVRGPDETEFQNDDANSSSRNPRILERLPAAGTYSIAVTSYQTGETGTYKLQASVSQRPIDASVSSRATGELGNGDERLDSGEFLDTLTFTGEAGDLVELRLSAADFDPYLMMRGPDDATFDNDDAAPGDTAALISATLPASGEYRVMVTSYAAAERGAYVLEVTGAEVRAQPDRSVRSRFGEAGSGTALAIGAPVNGRLEVSDPRLETGEYYDIYTLSGAPGTRATVRLESADFDTLLGAFGSDGFEASNDDDDRGQSTNSRVEVMLPVSGTITLAVSSYASGDMGAYTISAETGSTTNSDVIDPVGSVPLTLGDAVSGNLPASEIGSEARTDTSFVFQAMAGQEIDFLLTSEDFDPMLVVEGPAGFREENDDDPRSRTLNSRIRAALPEAGTYRVVVGSYNGAGAGAFRLTTGEALSGDDAAIFSAEAPALVLGELVSGMLADSDQQLSGGKYADLYRFEGQRGQRLSFTLESADFDTFLALDLPGGGREVNDDRGGIEDTNSTLAITLPDDGTYTLTASSYGAGQIGAYTMIVQTADETVRTVAPTSSNARVFALSVGVSDYARMEGLPLTDQDATKLTETLAATGMLAPQSVTLVNAAATRANVAAALQSITAAIGPDDLLLVFFSGHGDKVEGGNTEMDGSSETIELYDAALHDFELAEIFSGITSRTLLVIDACFSGGFDNVIDQRVDRMGVFSSDSDVLSLVAEKQQAGGYVSLLLREALGGAADSNGDLAITAGELSEYMRRGFYRLALEAPMDAGGEDFRGQTALGYQHMIVDRGGDGMPYGQILMRSSPSSLIEP